MVGFLRSDVVYQKGMKWGQFKVITKVVTQVSHGLEHLRGTLEVTVL